MAEYITRDSALAFQCEVEPVMCKSIVTGEVFSATPDAALVKFFNALPFADVREVKRGKWSVHEIYKHEMSYGTTAYEPVYKCSACGNLMESYLRYDEPIMPEDADFPRFCPNCGADMREEQT